MLRYDELKEKPREFLSVTSLTDEEFQVLLPTFEKWYQLSAKPKPKLGQTHLKVENFEQVAFIPTGFLAFAFDSSFAAFFLFQ